MEGGGTRAAARAIAAVFRSPALRRLELSYAASHLAQISYGVGVAVFAYGAGGASAVGLVYVLRLVPAAVVTPFAAVLGDRFPRDRVLLGSNLARLVLATGLTVAVAGGSAAWLVYLLAVLVSVAGTPFRPTQAAILPSLVDAPEELTAANVVSSTIEGLGFFAAPALAGVLLAVSGTTAVLVACTALFAAATALLVRPLPRKVAERHDTERDDAGFADTVLAGFRTVARDRNLRALVGMFAAQFLVAGALAVLLVVTALELLHTGTSGVGWLDAASGIGGLVGSLAAATLAGRSRLAPPFLAGIVLWGVPFLAIAVRPSIAVALLAFAVIGVGNILVDVAGFTLLQRSAPDSQLARVFGTLETLFYASVAIGAAVVPPLVSALGARWTLVATGAFLPALVLLAGPRLLRLDAATAAPTGSVELLRGIGLFAPLPPLALERLALHLVQIDVPAGTAVVTQGEPGDRYYVLARGGAEVVIDGRTAKRLVPGEGFGEIALLRDVPRTATIRTTEESGLLALDRETFLAAVTSEPGSLAAADDVANRLLGAVAGAV